MALFRLFVKVQCLICFVQSPNRYPAGSLLTMPVSNGGFGLRPFEGTGDELREQPNLMVLDGQQRLTSLYQALYQRNGVTVKKRTYHFYVDVGVLMSDPDGSIEVGDPFFERALFYVVVDKKGRRIRYEDLKPLYEITTFEQELDAGALPLGLTFDVDSLTQWKEQYLYRQTSELARYQELSRKWDKLVKSWIDRISNYPFPVVELRSNMPLGAICHIFEKVNSTGGGFGCVRPLHRYFMGAGFFAQPGMGGDPQGPQSQRNSPDAPPLWNLLFAIHCAFRFART